MRSLSQRKNMDKLIILTVITVMVKISVQQHCRKYADQVLLVSMDGFRWDYVNKVDTPNFDRIAREGGTTPHIKPVFTTKTFPSHYSIVTGLYTESHGIISNNMYDPSFDEYFSMSTRTPKWWDGGKPLWIAAKEQGLSSGTVFWPGSETEHHGIRPDFWLPYCDDLSFKYRIDISTEWLKKRKYNFVTLYFHEPDRTGHSFGPASMQINEKIKEMDSLLGYLLKQFDDKGLWASVNLILTSDHGMTAVDLQNKLVDASPLLHLIERTIDYGPIMQFIPKAGQEDALVTGLNNLGHISAYKKADIPDEWHYRNNIRITPVFAVAEEGWSITTNVTLAQRSTLKGQHGYDNSLDSMNTIFFSMGPNIASNVTLPPFDSVDIYPLICELLGIQPSPNNGSLENTAKLLQPFTDVQTCGGIVYNGNRYLTVLMILDLLFFVTLF